MTNEVQYVPNWSFGLNDTDTILSNLTSLANTLDEPTANELGQEKAAWAGWEQP